LEIPVMKTLLYASVAVLCLFTVNLNAATYSGGNGTAGSPYQIGSVTDWQTLMATPADWDDHFILTDNIDLAGVTITPIGNNTTKFSGTFDGDGHAFSNLAYTSIGKSNAIGLFGETWQAMIRNLGVVDVQIYPVSNYAGALVGHQTRGTITNCYSTGFINSAIFHSTWFNISNNPCNGGLVGQQYEGSISNCYSSCSVLTSYRYYDSGTRSIYTGGLVGGSNGTITGCYSTGPVTGSLETNYATTVFCYVGGLVGNSSATLTNCYSRSSVGGSIIGNAYSNLIYVGGLAGYRYWGSITNCYSTGYVPSAGVQYAGGLLAGSSGSGTISACFWDTQTSGQSASAGGEGKTTAQMQTLSTFTSAGWAFPGSGGTPDWYMPAMSYPVLIWQTTPVSVPNVVGMTQADAQNTITSASLTVGAITQAYSDTVPAGNVISQSPIAGTSVYIGTLVDLIVSLGKAVTIPDVAGMSQLDAESTILAAELVVGQVTQECSETVPAGNVISQSPAAGLTVLAGSSVNMIVSMGIATVPYVVEMSQADAEAAIVSAGLIAGQITPICSDTVPVGNVISQSLTAGSLVCFNSAVDLTVSAGMATVPYVIEMSQADAENTILSADLRVSVSWDYSDTIETGYVISQSPDADTLLCAGSWVDITVSMGRAIVVPDLTNIHRDDAESQIYDYELTLGTVRIGYDRSIPEAYVSMQSPAAGQIVPVGTPIDLMVAGGGGWDEDPFLIWTPQQLNSIGTEPNDWCASFKLMADIDMSIYSGTDYNIIGNESTNFCGRFDGNGFVIRNLNYSTKSAVNHVGLFGIANGAFIKDVRLEDAYVFTAGEYAGALVGRQWAGHIVRCSSTGSVGSYSDTTAHAGGLVGGIEFGCNITDCSSSCTVTASAVASESFAGGLVGQHDDGIISRCYTTGSVTALADARALAGGISGSVEWGGDVTICYSTASVAASAGYYEAVAGGITSRINDGAVRHSYSTGPVSSYSDTNTSIAAGLVGQQLWGDIAGCYSTGTATANGGGDNLTGGLMAVGDSAVNSFWDYEISGQSWSAGGEWKTTAEMKTQVTFTDAGWDFTNETVNGTNNIWRMCADGLNYPKLNWESIDGDFACPSGVDSTDLDYFFQRWLFVDCTADNNFCGGTDMNISGNVDLADFAIFADYWLEGI
jgi:beta-lactam-binding protein with PASTA domain